MTAENKYIIYSGEKFKTWRNKQGLLHNEEGPAIIDLFEGNDDCNGKQMHYYINGQVFITISTELPQVLIDKINEEWQKFVIKKMLLE